MLNDCHRRDILLPIRDSGFGFNVNLCSLLRKELDGNDKKSVWDAHLFL